MFITDGRRCGTSHWSMTRLDGSSGLGPPANMLTVHPVWALILARKASMVPERLEKILLIMR